MVTRSLRCFFKSHIDDLSLNKVATQSHTYLGRYYDAGNAVDGNTTTCMRTEPIGPNNPDKTVWWRVDLGGLRNIYSISVLFKNYNDYGDYILSLKSYVKLCAPMQYYDANPESFNNATFAQKYNRLVENVYV